MVFDSYIPQEQNSKSIKQKVTKLGFVPIDVGDGFEQYCKCDNPTCLELSKDSSKHESKPHQERNLLTFFRNIYNKYIGYGKSSGIRVSYVDLIFDGKDVVHKQVLSELPPLKLDEQMPKEDGKGRNVVSSLFKSCLQHNS
jgi:hypothetical protein